MPLYGLDDELPSKADGTRGYIYVLQYANGAVKIGSTSDPRRRVAEHDRYAQIFGRDRIACWLSPEHHWFMVNEYTLLDKALAATREGSIGEWFSGLNVKPILAAAERLDYNSVPAPPMMKWTGGTPESGPLPGLPRVVREVLSERAQALLRVALSYPPYGVPTADELKRAAYAKGAISSFGNGFGAAVSELKGRGYYAERLVGYPAPSPTGSYRGFFIRFASALPSRVRQMMKSPIERISPQYVRARSQAAF